MNGSSPNRYAMAAPPPRPAASIASPQSPFKGAVPVNSTSLTTMAAQKASPSDVMFGQPPGAHGAVQQLGALSSDSSPSSASIEASNSSRRGSRSNSRSRSFKAGAGFSPIAAEGHSSRGIGQDPYQTGDGCHARTEMTSTTSSSTASSSSADLGAKAAGGAGSSHQALASDTAPDRTSSTVEEAEGTTKVLPYLVDDAESEDIVALVADMLNRLMIHNDTLPLHPSALTRFHSRATPAITIHSYLRRIARYTSLDKACTLILLVYIDRVCERMKGFTICGLTVHRFVCAAVVCASKALCDAFSTNGHYARVGGISLVELNLLEKEFLEIIDWRLTCSGALLQHYYTSLVTSHPAYRLAADPNPPSPLLSSSAASDEDMEEEEERREVQSGLAAADVSDSGGYDDIVGGIHPTPAMTTARSVGKGPASGNRGREREVVGDDGQDRKEDVIEGRKRRGGAEARGQGAGP